MPTPSRIPRTIWALGLVSLTMDLSSELVHALLPMYLVSTLGASALALGLIEGAAEAVALVVKVFSGALSDLLGRRKLLLLLGYGFSALTKPLFPLARSVFPVFAARFLDRVGKGVRGAPRDALIADLSPPEIRGRCFGLRQSMDTVGALLGPLAAIGLMLLLHGNLRLVLWFATLPAFVCVLLIIFGVSESRAATAPAARPHFRPAALKRFPRAYWRLLLLGAAFTLARFSEAFLILRAHDAGLSSTWAPLVMVVMSATYALSAFPAGILSDRLGRFRLLPVGMTLLLLADLALALGSSIPLALLGAGLWGLHLGFSEGILAAMIADVTPSEFKGTAFGLYYLVCGLCLFPASFLAGLLWERTGPAATFLAGAGFAALALALLLRERSKRRPATASSTASAP